jgi:hypothetical protein
MSHPVTGSVTSTTAHAASPINPAQAQTEAATLEKQIRAFDVQIASLQSERQPVVRRLPVFAVPAVPPSALAKIAKLGKEVASDQRELHSPALQGAVILRAAVSKSQGSINQATTLAEKAAAYRQASVALYQAAEKFEKTQGHGRISDGPLGANWSPQQVTSLVPFMLKAESDEQQADQYQIQADEAQIASISSQQATLRVAKPFSQEDKVIIADEENSDATRISALTAQKASAKGSLLNLNEDYQLYDDMAVFTGQIPPGTSPNELTSGQYDETTLLLEEDPYISRSDIIPYGLMDGD